MRTGPRQKWRISQFLGVIIVMCPCIPSLTPQNTKIRLVPNACKVSLPKTLLWTPTRPYLPLKILSLSCPLWMICTNALKSSTICYLKWLRINRVARSLKWMKITGNVTEVSSTNRLSTLPLEKHMKRDEALNSRQPPQSYFRPSRNRWERSKTRR